MPPPPSPTAVGLRSSSVLDRAAGAQVKTASSALPGGSWLATQGRLPLAYMGLALAWLSAAAIATALSPDLLALPHIAPPVIALTHMWVLGFFVTVAVGAIYQLAPVALGITLWSERLGWIHFALHGIGVPLMIAAFWQWNLPLLIGGGGVVATGIVLFAFNTWHTVHRSGKRDGASSCLP